MSETNFTKNGVTSPFFGATGLTGATEASRYVGGTESDAPAAGTFEVGDFVIAHDGKTWICTVAGSPGTWVDAGGSGGSGTVTSVKLTAPAEFSVAGSPITTAGELAITKAVQNANKVWAGPTTGADAEPAFRALVVADIPAGLPYLASMLASSKILVGDGVNVAAPVAMGGDVEIDNTGVTTIATNAITNVKIAANAGITLSKLEAVASGNILVGNGSNNLAEVVMSGDTGIDNTGAVTIGNGKVMRAKLGGAEQLLLPYKVASDALSSESSTSTVSVAGMVSTDVVTANIKSSSNAVSIQKITSGTGSFVVLMSGDPGAASEINYVAYHTV